MAILVLLSWNLKVLMSTTKLSVIILGQADHPHLKKAINSVKFANQVEVITSSKEIADFAQARNQALRQAQYDWVLFLDSDEELDQNSIPEIEKLIRQDLVSGATIIRQDIFYHQPLKHGEAGHIKLLRLGRKKSFSWQRPVHEIAQVEGRVEQSQIKLLHYAHTSFDDFISSVSRYARLEAQYRHDQGKKFKLAELLFFPPGKFVVNYVVKLGFLDGWRGLGYAFMMSLHSFAVRVNQYELA